MTSTTSRSSWSTGPSRSCPNDRRRVRRIRPEPRGRPPDRRALRERGSRGVRLRAESARPREPVGPPRHDRIRGLGCRRGGPAVPCSRHIPGRAVLLGPRDLGRDCLRARDVVPTRPHLSDQSGLDPTAVGPRSDLRPCPRLGLLDLDDRVGHQRDVVERLRSQRPGRADLRLPRARVLRLDVHFCMLFVRSWWQVRKTPSRWVFGVVLLGLIAGTVPAAVTELLWPILSSNDTRVGLGSLYTLMWSIFIAYAVVRYRYLVIEPVTEARTARAPRHRLERGLNYLVLENGRTSALGAFRDIVSATPGLCVTGLAPSRVSVRFGLERTPILWITTVSNEERTVRPNALDFELVHTVVKFLRENPGTAVLLDDLDYLATLAGFDAVARFLKRVTNQASASKGTVIVAAGFGTFPPEQIALLRGSVDRVLEVQEAIASSTPGAEHVLMTINAQDAPVALPLVGARRGLLLTTEHPTKARLRYGDRFDIVWVTEQPEPGVPSVRPNALDTEGRRAIGNSATAHEGMDIVLVGLEQLALYVDLRSWLPFVKDSLDIASLHGCRLFLTIAPEALSPQELAVLARRFDTGLSPSMFKGSAPSGPTTAAPENRIPYREPSA